MKALKEDFVGIFTFYFPLFLFSLDDWGWFLIKNDPSLTVTKEREKYILQQNKNGRLKIEQDCSKAVFKGGGGEQATIYCSESKLGKVFNIWICAIFSAKVAYLANIYNHSDLLSINAIFGPHTKRVSFWGIVTRTGEWWRGFIMFNCISCIHTSLNKGHSTNEEQAWRAVQYDAMIHQTVIIFVSVICNADCSRLIYISHIMWSNAAKFGDCPDASH